MYYQPPYARNGGYRMPSYRGPAMASAPAPGMGGGTYGNDTPYAPPPTQAATAPAQPTWRDQMHEKMRAQYAMPFGGKQTSGYMGQTPGVISDPLKNPTGPIKAPGGGINGSGQQRLAEFLQAGWTQGWDGMLYPPGMAPPAVPTAGMHGGGYIQSPYGR